MSTEALDAAIADAYRTEGAASEGVGLKTIYLEKATTLRCFGARAMGRGTGIAKQSSHIFVTVGD